VSTATSPPPGSRANAAGDLGIRSSGQGHDGGMSDAAGAFAVLAFLAAGFTAAFRVRRQLRG
jgi:hypothetical protein